MIRFEVQARCGEARAGILHTPHGEVQTPAFQSVATQATVKALDALDVSRSGARLLIMNTYHLWLRPGAELVAKLGGLHVFARWPHAISTDSGGFQAFSLADRTRLDEDGFEFASHLDGSRHRLSPEEAMRIQGLLGSDIAMQLDVCPPAGSSREVLVQAVERTSRWAERCLASKCPDQALFGIVQGGTDVELRLQHVERLSKLPFDGLALGGFSVGESPVEMYRALPLVASALPASLPRYLMGLGTPRDIVHAIGWGVDLFDCVLPTRNARNGQVFVRGGRLVIKNARYRDDPRPLEPGCACPCCGAGYSRSYLRHLYQARELLAYRLLSLHNVWYYQRLVREARVAIEQGDFVRWAKAAVSDLDAAPDPQDPHEGVG